MDCTIVRLFLEINIPAGFNSHLGFWASNIKLR